MWPAVPGSGNSGFHPGLDFQIGAAFGRVGGSISAGDELYVPVHWGATVLGWELLGNTNGALVVDVRAADPTDHWPPVAGDSIAGTHPPTIAASHNYGRALVDASTWTTVVLRAGAALCFHVVSVTAITDATVALWCRR